MVVDHFRPGTDDTKWAIPELVDQDMYRVGDLVYSLRDTDGPVLDCGAHIGVFSCVLAAHGLSNPIHAFEPEPANYELLVKNAQKYPTISTINKAVGCGEAQLCLTDCGGTGRWSAVPRDGDGRASIRVEAVDLYDYIRNLDRVALLKLDLEGFEAEILNRMPADVLDKVFLLITEEHHRPINYERLRDAGFWLWYTPLGMPRHRVFRKDIP